MDRRRFLQLALVTPFLVPRRLAAWEAVAKPAAPRFIPGTARSFPSLEVAGSYREIGWQIGRHFASNIHTVIERRKQWHAGLMETLASAPGRRLSAALLQLSGKHLPHYLEELRGMADGAGLSFDAMWAMTIKSELATLEAAPPPAVEPEPPGCSTLLCKDAGRAWLLHNEDGHAAYADQMGVVQVTPPSGVRFVAMIYPGILTGNGPSLNSRGIVQTTNYIGSVRAEAGIPRYLIGRAILEAKNLREAEQLACLEPRAYPYHHNLASVTEQRYLSVETTPESSSTLEPEGLYIHTNHLLHDSTAGYEHQDEQYRGSSSLSRYQVLTRLAAEQDLATLTPEQLLVMLSSHDRRPYSPCRHPQGDIRGQTLGTGLYDLHHDRFRLYRGNPCEARPKQRFTELPMAGW